MPPVQQAASLPPLVPPPPRPTLALAKTRISCIISPLEHGLTRKPRLRGAFRFLDLR
jgi:hypothetical protein